MMDLMNRIRRLQQAARMARSGARIFKNAGFSETLGPRQILALARTARDARRGVKGGAAIIHLHALSDPLRPALVDGDVRLSYGELEERVNRLTHGLRALGVGPGERIAAFLYNGHEYLELTAALNAVGGASVNVGYRLKAGEVAYILENSGARAMLFHGDLAPVVDEALTLVKQRQHRARALHRCRRRAGIPQLRGSPGQRRGGGAGARAGGGYGGVMIYTSGTTGRAKGATRDFRRMGMEPVLDFVSRFPLRRDERHLVVCPLYHSMAAAFVTMIFMVGGCSVIVRHFDPELVLRTIEQRAHHLDRPWCRR